MNKNQKIATTNLILAALLLLASIPFEALRVMAVPRSKTGDERTNNQRWAASRAGWASP